MVLAYTNRNCLFEHWFVNSTIVNSAIVFRDITSAQHEWPSLTNDHVCKPWMAPGNIQIYDTQLRVEVTKIFLHHRRFAPKTTAPTIKCFNTRPLVFLSSRLRSASENWIPTRLVGFCNIYFDTTDRTFGKILVLANTDRSYHRETRCVTAKFNDAKRVLYSAVGFRVIMCA